MTTSNLMSLPLDIPWKRLATSRDMIDTKYGDSRYPPGWFSSLSIFYYEPPKEEQTVAGRTVTFLKVSCTVTALQLVTKDLKSIGVNPALLDRYPWAIQFWNKTTSQLARTYPCLGALAHVAVFPNGLEDDVPLSQYPIVMDFEPKKRELYESAVKNVSHLSGSRSSLSVKKSTRVVDSQETSWNLGGSVSANDDTFGGSFGGGFGSKSGTSVETVDSISTDFSREKRENYAYTTNLTHMYHLLSSYHVGTNRAMFTLRPRPHITETDFVFTGAPQKLEGIQDFFLIIDRPESIPNICVEATLESAHLIIKSKYQARLIPASEVALGDNAKKTAGALGLSAQDRDWNYETLVYGGTYGGATRPGWNNIAADKRAVIALRIAHGLSFAGLVKLQKDKGLTLTTKAEWDNVEAVVKLAGADPVTAVEDLAVIYESTKQQDGTIAVLGRTTSSCTGPDVVLALDRDRYLAYEKPLFVPGNISSILADPTAPNAAKAVAANQLNDIIGNELVDSVSAPDRLPSGTVAPEEADFVQEMLAEAMLDMPTSHAYNVPIAAIEGIDADMSERLSQTLGVERRADAVTLEAGELEAALGLSRVDALHLRSQLLGKGPALDEPSPSGIGRPVPRVVDLALDEARQLLTRAGFRGEPEIVYRDGIEPEDVVVGQFPLDGTLATMPQPVRLVASSGPVDVPKVDGMAGREAAAALEEAGLTSLETPVDSSTQDDGLVLGTVPAAGSLVARHSVVTLLVNRPRKR